MKQTIVEIQGSLNWRAFRDPASGNFIGICDSLRLTLEGDSLADLAETIDDAVHALLSNLFKHNEFDKFMLEHGWKLVGTRPLKIDQDVRFEVPMDIILRPARDFQTAVYQ